MTISKDRVKPSPLPDSWKLAEIFTTGIVLGSYLAMMTVIFFWAAYKTDFFPVRWPTFGCKQQALVDPCDEKCLKFSFRLLICVHLNCVFMPTYFFWCFFLVTWSSWHTNWYCACNFFSEHLGCHPLRKQLMMTSESLPQQYICKWAPLVRPLYLWHDLEVGPSLSVLGYCLW